MFTSPRDTSATNESALYSSMGPNLESHQNSIQPATTLEHNPERPDTPLTAARVQKYRLGQISRQHAEQQRSASSLSTRPESRLSVVPLNPPLIQPPMEFAPMDYSREAPPSRPTTAMSWHRPSSHKRGGSGKTSSQGTIKDVFVDRDIPVVQSFTALPPTISRAAAKRLGLYLDELFFPAEPRIRSRRSTSLLSDSDDEPILRHSVEESIEGFFKHQQDVPAIAHPVRDSWPLRTKSTSTTQTVETSEEDDDDLTESVVSNKSSKTSCDTDLPSKIHEHSADKLVAPRPPSRPQSRARKLKWLTGLSMPDTSGIDDGQYTVREKRQFEDVNIHPALRASGQTSPIHQKRYDFEAHMEEAISPDAAEKVIHCIFERIDSFDDIFAAARINRGFYNVFKRHELELMKRVLYNASPAEWEYRETSAKEIMPGRHNTQPDYTPTLYVQFHRRDAYILKSLRASMFGRCQPLLRQETINALHAQSCQRTDDAIWRIWTFCDIFGSGKGGETDFVAQKTWLNGGIAPPKPSDGRRSRTARYATLTSFGKGNHDGLSIAELEDMLEVWKCMRLLLKGVMGPGRVAQARRYGLFNGMTIDYSDELAEEATLEEWVHYVLTLGPSTVVDLADLATSKSSNVFKTARDMGWTTWRPCPKGGCRSKFLKDVVTALIAECQPIPLPEISESQPSAPNSKQQKRSVNKLKKVSHQPVGAPPTLSELDDSVGIWVSWVSKHEEPPASAQPTKPLPALPVMARQQRHRPIVLPAQNAEEGKLSSSLRRSQPLCLFPPQYSTRSNTPSRSPSLARRSESDRSSEVNSIISKHMSQREREESMVHRGIPLNLAMA